MTRCTSRPWLGVGAALLVAAAAQAQNSVTFQIDMAPISPTVPTAVAISGTFNGWPAPAANTSYALINVGGTVWSNTFTLSDAVGTVEQCKFQYESGDNWESIPNREFELSGPDANGGGQVLPLTSWNVNSTWPTPTNQVTFQVDLSAQVALGNFNNGTITVSGDFEGWDNGLPLTNNPASTDATTNIYKGTYPVVGFPGGTTINYKFRMNGGWESPASTGGNNRQSAISSPNQVLPLVYYNDNSIHDLVLTPIPVTFTLTIADGTVDNAGVPFVKGTDHVYINGDFLGWWGWNTGVGGSETAADEMTNNPPGSDTYQQTFLIPKGNSIYLTYKYSVDGFDDENGFATNHVREIRSYGPSYNFPLDVWSWTLPPGSNTTSAIIEPDFGNLAVGGSSGGNIPITWLGRPGVVLQNNSSLTGAWNDNAGTDGTQATNWPNTGPAQYFRLKKQH